MPTRPHLLSAFVLLLSLALLLPATGCAVLTGEREAGQGQNAVVGGGAPTGGEGGTYSVAPQDAAKRIAQAPSAETPSGQTADGATTAAEQLIIRTKSMTLRVKNAKKSKTAAEALAKRYGGFITDASVTSQGGQVITPQMEGGQPSPTTTGPGPFTAVVTVKVPAAKYEGLIGEARKLGDVLVENESQQDVTQQHADLAARLKNLKAEETRLQTFFDRAKNVRELLEVERELARVRGEIESMQAQLDYLNRQVALATLTLTLEEPPRIVGPTSPEGWGVLGAFGDAIRLFVEVIKFLIRLTGLLLPFLIMLAIVWLLIRRRNKRWRAKKAAEETQASQGPADKGPKAGH
jgi:hypothetical protein